MVVPSYQDGKTDEYFNMNIDEEDTSTDTRKAGMNKPNEINIQFK